MIDSELVRRLLLNMITEVQKWRVDWVYETGKAFTVTDGKVSVHFFGSNNGHIKINPHGVHVRDIHTELIKEVYDFWINDATKLNIENSKKLREHQQKLSNILNQY